MLSKENINYQITREERSVYIDISHQHPPPRAPLFGGVLPPTHPKLVGGGGYANLPVIS